MPVGTCSACKAQWSPDSRFYRCERCGRVYCRWDIGGYFCKDCGPPFRVFVDYELYEKPSEPGPNRN